MNFKGTVPCLKFSTGITEYFSIETSDDHLRHLDAKVQNRNANPNPNPKPKAKPNPNHNPDPNPNPNANTISYHYWMIDLLCKNTISPITVTVQKLHPF